MSGYISPQRITRSAAATRTEAERIARCDHEWVEIADNRRKGVCCPLCGVMVLRRA